MGPEAYWTITALSILSANRGAILKVGRRIFTSAPKNIRSVGAAARGFTKIPKGFKEVKKFGYQHGQKVYEYKGKYYSKDIDGHNGGVWKVFEEVGGRLNRIGTADGNLIIFTS